MDVHHREKVLGTPAFFLRLSFFLDHLDPKAQAFYSLVSYPIIQYLLYSLQKLIHVLNMQLCKNAKMAKILEKLKKKSLK
jgi:hypothetical protein